MKNFLKAIVVFILSILVRAIVAKYKPQIVMVTGSVGKTSTKDAIAAALSQTFYLRASEKSYNSEFGVPLTVIGAKNPWNNFSGWLSVFTEALGLIFLPSHYPKLLVLEVGADRPGDLKKILRFVHPDAVVVTRLPEVPVHVEAYATPSAVRDEEFLPAYELPRGAPLIISADDPYTATMAKRLDASITTVGYSKADITISNPTFSKDPSHLGMTGTAMLGSTQVELHARGSVGRSQLYAPAMALALAHALGMSTKDALSGLLSYSPPPGRARVHLGIKDTILVDDTYNSSPAAVEEVLADMQRIEGKRYVAILGDMLELGRYSVSEHERIGALVGEKMNTLITVGTRATGMQEAAHKAGLSEGQSHSFSNSFEAAQALPDILMEGDVVLIKGSQSIRMERITEALLQNKEDTKHLVRQDKEWKKR